MLNKIVEEGGEVVIPYYGWDCSGDCGCGSTEYYTSVCDSSAEDLALLIGRLINYRRKHSFDDVIQKMADALLLQIKCVYEK